METNKNSIRDTTRLVKGHTVRIIVYQADSKIRLVYQERRKKDLRHILSCASSVN